MVSGDRAMSEREEFAARLGDLAGSEGFIAIVILLAVAGAAFSLLYTYFRRALARQAKRSKNKWDDILIDRRVVSWAALLVPLLILYFGVPLALPDVPELLRRIILALVAVNVAIVLHRLLAAGHGIYELYAVSKRTPIQGLIQAAKLLVLVLGVVIGVSVALDRSPWGLLGGIGAITALMVLVFRDTILSFIASIQIVVNDLVDVGDWIEMPEYGADGDVIGITLQTVKVQNWDKTIVTIPTNKLVEGSFKNWRGMKQAGGRRIKRSLLIDQTSVRFCDEDLLRKLSRVHRLRPYLEAKREELAGANARLDAGEETAFPINRRTLTNLGTFRAYIEAYLDENARLYSDVAVTENDDKTDESGERAEGKMTLMVRQRTPTAEGIPLEIYVFSSETDWKTYEGIQADIFDHLLGVLPYFDLRVFQHPTGHDLSSFIKAREHGLDDESADVTDAA